MDGDRGGRGLVVAAHRLPVVWDEVSRRWRASPGGLVTALSPVLRERGGVWVGWNGTAGGGSRSFTADGIRARPVIIDAAEIEGHYDGFCNGTIWPLYHDAIRPLEFHRHWWRPHVEVNQRFATTVARVAGREGVVWAHDYQLQLVPEMVRRRRPDVRIGFFLHIPFPPVEIFARLPWRAEILRGMLGADHIAFQTRRGALNFADAAREFVGASGPANSLQFAGREVRAETVPISIDVAEIKGVAMGKEAQELAGGLRRDLGSPEKVILGVDRLDYTKGIDLRLRAFEVMLERHSDLLGRVSMVQIAVPSREDVEEYQVMRRRVEESVGRINGRFERAGWTPVHYFYREFPIASLVGAYLTADVMLVTPLRDGMNLVALEYVAARRDNSGVLVLSEFAGASERLSDAVVVNPYDIDGLSRALHAAVMMGSEEQARRMARLRRAVGRWDVHGWARRNIRAIER